MSKSCLTFDNLIKELKNEATDENKAEPEVKDVDKKDVFPAEEHKEAEEVEEADDVISAEEFFGEAEKEDSDKEDKETK